MERSATLHPKEGFHQHVFVGLPQPRQVLLHDRQHFQYRLHGAVSIANLSPDLVKRLRGPLATPHQVRELGLAPSTSDLQSVEGTGKVSARHRSLDARIPQQTDQHQHVIEWLVCGSGNWPNVG